MELEQFVHTAPDAPIETAIWMKIGQNSAEEKYLEWGRADAAGIAYAFTVAEFAELSGLDVDSLSEGKVRYSGSEQVHQMRTTMPISDEMLETHLDAIKAINDSVATTRYNAHKVNAELPPVPKQDIGNDFRL